MSFADQQISTVGIGKAIFLKVKKKNLQLFSFYLRNVESTP